MMSTSNDAEKISPAMRLCNTSSMPVLCQILSAKTSENQMQDKTVRLCITVYFTRAKHRTVLPVCSNLKKCTMSNREKLQYFPTT